MLAWEWSVTLSVFTAIRNTSACIALWNHVPQKQESTRLVHSGSQAVGVPPVRDHPYSSITAIMATHS